MLLVELWHFLGGLRVDVLIILVGGIHVLSIALVLAQLVCADHSLASRHPALRVVVDHGVVGILLLEGLVGLGVVLADRQGLLLVRSHALFAGTEVHHLLHGILLSTLKISAVQQLLVQLLLLMVQLLQVNLLLVLLRFVRAWVLALSKLLELCVRAARLLLLLLHLACQIVFGALQHVDI